MLDHAKVLDRFAHPAQQTGFGFVIDEHLQSRMPRQS
jgi:hypothetical protein